MRVDVDNVKDNDTLSRRSEHLGLLTTRRDLDVPQRVSETLKTRLNIFTFEENVHSMLLDNALKTLVLLITHAFLRFYKWCLLEKGNSMFGRVFPYTKPLLKSLLPTKCFAQGFSSMKALRVSHEPVGQALAFLKASCPFFFPFLITQLRFHLVTQNHGRANLCEIFGPRGH